MLKIFVEDLTETDYRILEYVRDNEPVKIDKIKEAFPDISSLEYRIAILATPEYRHSSSLYNVPIPIKNSYCLKEEHERIENELHIEQSIGLGIYTLTDLGKKALQDYKISQKQATKDMWLKNAWLPILVTIATNLVIYGLKWLFPLIAEWLSNSHL